MHTLEEKLGYVFKNKALLEKALQPPFWIAPGF